MRGPRALWSRVSHEPMFASALHLMSNTVLTNVLGVAFWVLAARTYSVEDVGRDSAVIAAVVTMSSIGQLDLGNAIVRFLPAVSRHRGRILLGSYALAGAASLVVGAAVIYTVPGMAANLAFLGEDRSLQLALVVSVALWSVFALQDSALTALDRAAWVPLANAGYGVAKLLALLLAFRAGVEHGVLWAFLLPMALLLVPVNLAVFRRALPSAPRPAEGREPWSPDQLGRSGLARLMAQDYTASVLIQAALTALPLLVVGLLGSSSGAFFFLPLTIITAVDAIVGNACVAFTVSAARTPERYGELLRLLVRRALPVLMLGVATLVAVAPLVLRVFGEAYADNASTILRLLALATLSGATVSLFNATCRLRGDGQAILLRQVLGVGTLIVGTIVLAPRFGLTGIGLAWVSASLVVLVTVVTPLLRELRTDALVLERHRHSDR